MANVLTQNLSEPLDGTKTARIDISTDIGNLTIDRQTGSDQLLASGTLEYEESRGIPDRTLKSNEGLTVLTLKGCGYSRPSFRFPWSACNAETEWVVHLNPTVPSEINAHSGGGNVKLDLSGMKVTRLSANTGGGNMDVVLPEDAADLDVIAASGAGNVSVDIGSRLAGSSTVSARSGAGNVSVRIPAGLAARIHAGTGMGKIIMDPRMQKIDRKTYQSPDFDSAANKVDVTIESGAGNVTVATK